MRRYAVLGDAELREDGTVEGWCWSPDRPSDRLAVEVLLDGRVVASAIADRRRRDLALAGTGDGHHAFRTGPSEPAIRQDAWLLSVRERATQRIFAQRRLRTPPPRPELVLDQLEAEIARARRSMPAQAASQHASAIRAGFAGAATAIDRVAHGPIGAGRRSIRRVLSGIPIPAFGIAAVPAITLLVVVSEAEAVGAIVQDWLPALRDGTAELFLADSGRDPCAPLLASVLPAASFLSIRQSGGMTQAVAEAAAAARGRSLLIFTTAAIPGGQARYYDARLRAPMAPGDIYAGPVVTRAAERLDGSYAMLTVDATRASAASDLLLACPPALLVQFGGFDPALDESPALAALDVCFKALVAGAVPIWLRHDAAVATEPASRAHRCFAQRWGAIAVDA